MPITTGFTSRELIAKGEGHVHSDKWHRCWQHVQDKGHDTSSAAAICTDSIGYSGSINKESRTGGKHASTKHRKTAAQVLKFNANHGADGRFAASTASGAGTGSMGSQWGPGRVGFHRPIEGLDKEVHDAPEFSSFRRSTVPFVMNKEITKGLMPLAQSNANLDAAAKLGMKQIPRNRVPFIKAL